MSDFLDTEEQDDNNDFDVIIVGSGLTGLTTAYFLLKKEIGLNVLILEATENIGGKIFLTEESKCFYAHPCQINIVELLDELNIVSISKRKSSSKERIYLTKSGPYRKLSSYISAQIYNFLTSIQNISLDFQLNMHSEEDANFLSNMSLDQLSSNFVTWGTARSICQSLLLTSCGISNLKKVSTLWYLFLLNGAGGFFQRLKITLGDEKRFFIKNGMAELVKILSSTIKKKQGVINCLEPVSNIQFSDTRAYVTTNNKLYKCEYVVVAVPPPESVEITVQPSLSPILSKVQTLFENGKNLFFTATFRQEFRNANYNCPMNIITTPDCDSSLKFLYDSTHSSNKSQLVLAGFLNESNFQTRKKFNFFTTLNQCFREFSMLRVNMQKIGLEQPMEQLKLEKLHHWRFFGEYDPNLLVNQIYLSSVFVPKNFVK
ncbi:amine oxidase [flavin-containing]-like isoform X2 [Leptopilina boulardi]|uniref:amine oxidase [flavin-containing]-like isoform X2 n=1 Tax=Leptopilina boulardi TaxID=63433 RepID=UPI0021F5C4F0|nr:amine oxidase [flavin-containing]-like isoform X2 [Leptopilina boulardi]